MSSLPVRQLPQNLSEKGWKDVATVTYKLTENDMTLKNGQPWKIKKKYWRAEFYFVVKLGPADLKFQIVGKNGLLSSDHDSLQVDFLDPSDYAPSMPAKAAPEAVQSNGSPNGTTRRKSAWRLTKDAFNIPGSQNRFTKNGVHMAGTQTDPYRYA